MAVTNNLTLIHACDAATDATTSAVLTSGSGGGFLTAAGEYVQGTGAYGFDLDIETHTVVITPTASINLSGQTLWWWVNSLTPNYTDTWQNGGHKVTLSDGTNTSTWFITGSDRQVGKWTRLCFSTGSSPDAVSGTLSLTAVTVITFSWTGVTKSKLPENTFIDYIQYGADGTGITVTGGTSGTPETFADVVGDDVTLAAGMIEEASGVYYLNGPVEAGDNSGTGDTYFKDSNQLLASISHYRTFTNATRGTAESLVSSSHNAIDVVGNSTGTTSFVFGEKTGTLGYAGNTVKTGGDRRISLTCTDTNVNTFQIYGSNFIDCGAISLPTASGTAREVISTSFNGCDQIDPSTCIMDTIVIADTNASLSGGLLIDASGTTNLSNITFISGGTGHAISLTDTGDKTYTNFFFIGYGGTPGSNLTPSSGSTDAMVYNTSGGAATYTVSGGDTPSARNGAGATTTVTASVAVTITVKDRAGTLLSSIPVAIVETADQDNEIMNTVTNVSGVATTAYTGGTPLNVTVNVRKGSGGTNYREVDSPQVIASSTGLTATITLEVDPINST